MLERTFRLYSIAPVLSFDSMASISLARLVDQRLRVATMDLRIAAIAISRNLILLTRNLKDFGKISDLRTEDWTN